MSYFIDWNIEFLLLFKIKYVNTLISIYNSKKGMYLNRLLFPIYIGFRYTITKRKKNGYASFIACMSILGISLGVAILIAVLSIMNGFDYEIRERIFSIAKQVTAINHQNVQYDLDNLKKLIMKNKDVIACSPFIVRQGLLSKDGIIYGIEINGILSAQESQVSQIYKNMICGSMHSLKNKKFSIVLGKSVAQYLKVGLGDEIVMITPRINNRFGNNTIIPMIKKFIVTGIFHASDGFGYDATTVFINYYDAKNLFGSNEGNIEGFNIKIKDPYRAILVSKELSKRLNNIFLVSDWTTKYGPYFKAIQMEKTIIFVILLFIITVATFNLVSSLMMNVMEKQAEIAILRTLGATPFHIMCIFIIQGGIIGLFGSILGMIGGCLLSISAPHLVKFLESVIGMHFISETIYYIDYLPSKLEWSNVLTIGLIAFTMSLFATIYPSWKAANIKPINALKYE